MTDNLERIEQLLESEKGNNKPASDELCKNLGINEKSVTGIMQHVREASEGLRTRDNRETKSPFDRWPEYGRGRERETVPPTPSVSAIAHEAMLTAVSTYIANRSSAWFKTPLLTREKEITFLIDMLVRASKELNKP